MLQRPIMLALLPVVLLMAAPAAGGAQSSGTTTKRALIIAIGDYPVEQGYAKIHVSRDVELVRATLRAQGFDSASVRVIEDAAATREGILNALDRLIASAETGAAIVVHYSGHGHRISDDNGDELDGYDEVLVPYGAPASVRAAEYRGERHIRDEEFGARLDLLRRKIGRAGSLTVLIDACFSGSGTRGAPEEASIRGVAEPIVVAGARVPPSKTNDDGSGLLDRSPLSRGGDESATSGMAPMVVISASRHDQVAREAYDEQHTPVGSLSLAVSRVLPRMTPGATYRDLFDRLGSAMAGMNLGEQSPQLEGAIDAQVFSGHIVAQGAFLRVTATTSDSLVEITGGRLLGLLPGSRVAFHRRGTSDPLVGTPLASGVVSTSSESRAMVALTAPADLGALRESWVFVTEYAYGDLRVRVAVDSTLSPGTASTIREALRSISIVEMVRVKPEVRIAAIPGGRGGTQVALYDAVSAIRLTAPLNAWSSAFPDLLRTVVRGLARADYLRRLALNSPRLRVRMELVRTQPRVTWSGATATCSGAAPTPMGSAQTTEGVRLSPRDEYTLRLVNEGPDAAYVVVLDLQPDGRISQIFPLTQSSGSDNYLLAGKSFLVPDICFWAEEPFGPELLKLFATKERVDFSGVLSGAMSASRGAESALDRLFEDVYTGTRGAAVAPAGMATTYGLTINVVPRRPARRPGG